MQDADRPAQIQALPEPARACRPRMEAEPLRLVPRPAGPHRIGGRPGPRRRARRRAACALPVGWAPLLVARGVVPATEQGEIRERGRAPLRPVAEMMPLAERQPAAREAAGAGPGGGGGAATR